MALRQAEQAAGRIVRVRYTPHARKRQRERNVTDAEVENVLRRYETEIPARDGRRHRYKVIGARRIRVTFDYIPGDEYIVWTVTVDKVVRDGT